MKFCVNNKGISDGGTMFIANWTTEKPHDFRSGDAVFENNDSAQYPSFIANLRSEALVRTNRLRQRDKTPEN